MKDFLGFRPKYSVLGTGSLPGIIRARIANSVVIREGGAVIDNGTTGISPVAAHSTSIFGYVVGFEDKDGFSYKQKTTNFNSMSESVQGDTYTATTSETVAALLIPAFGVVCSGILNAAAATTTGSNLLGYFLDSAGASTGEEYLLESSASTAKAQFKLMPGVSTVLATDPEHPESTLRVMVLGEETLQAYDAGA